ncbi:MAG: hypothetical protein MK135_16855, partial [Polyangiaceae bacterium]|nr:hypothetical protein [Polyangiaceae bacterium]
VGGVGLVTGIVGAVWAGVELGNVNRECPDACTSAGIDAAARGRTAVWMMVGGFSVGALGTGTGFYLLNRGDGEGAATNEKPENEEIAFSPLPGGFRVNYRLRW